MHEGRALVLTSKDDFSALSYVETLSDEGLMIPTVDET